MWGIDLHGWEQLMLVSLGFAALAAVFVTVTTGAVVRLQKEEAAHSSAELDKYKAASAAEVGRAHEGIEKAKGEAARANESAALANARAAEAQLALEKFKAPRKLSLEQQAAIVAKIGKFAGQKFDMAVNAGDPEANDLLDTIENILTRAGWVAVDWNGGDVVFTRPSRQVVGIVTMTGVFAQMEREKVAEFEAPAVILMGTLNLEGIESKAEAGQIPHAQNKDVLHIMVGKKP